MNTRGFTSQEPYLPIAILLILVAIAIPGFSRARRELRLRQAMRADLEAVVGAQSRYFARHHGYAARLTAAPTESSLTLPLRASNRVSIGRADSTGWAATVSNDSVTRGERHCGVYVGSDRYAPDRHVRRAANVSCW